MKLYTAVNKDGLFLTRKTKYVYAPYWTNHIEEIGLWKNKNGVSNRLSAHKQEGTIVCLELGQDKLEEIASLLRSGHDYIFVE